VAFHEKDNFEEICVNLAQGGGKIEKKASAKYTARNTLIFRHTKR